MLKNYYRVLEPEMMTLCNGEKAVLRFLRPSDASRLYTFLHSLSFRSRRHLTAHPMDMKQITALCDTLDPSTLLRFVATTPDNAQLIAYLILHIDTDQANLKKFKAVGGEFLPGADCAVAIALVDKYRRSGVLEGLFNKAAAVGQMLGRSRTLYWHTYASSISGQLEPQPINAIG
ncbi:hypothetical protein GO730_35070 [Spirosoma sp. HMF3257]|uniref:GNAT family N-acetyltransferase n=1 Tax=Spirosoma telluris TaxID=2183553 RepID=A0A327NRH5_9BACT|nr:hypothetical protein [Spirosoma telluris]RAI78001.1 hypothetical protein HMF3257_34965 [Spirosoma telluris]